MVDPVSFYVEGTPVPQGSKSMGRKRDGSPFMRESGGHRLTAWRRAVRDEAKVFMVGRPKFSGPVGVVLTFALRHPASHAQRVTWPTGRPDVDKLARGVLDAITGPVIEDDAQIVTLSARKCWAGVDIDQPPGVLIWCGYVPGFPGSPR